jgi:hypothetical protein
MKLYEITKEFKEVESLDDIPPEAMADTLEAIRGEFEGKALAVMAFMLNQQSDLDQLEGHKKKIEAKIKTLKSKNEKLKHYLRVNMEQCGIKKINGALYGASLGEPSEIVVVDDDHKVPNFYFDSKSTLNKVRVKEALKSGLDVPGAHIGNGKPRLTIG